MSNKARRRVSDVAFAGAGIGAIIGSLSCTYSCASGNGYSETAFWICLFVGGVIGAVIQSSSNQEIDRKNAETQAEIYRKNAETQALERESARLTAGHRDTPAQTTAMLNRRDFGSHATIHEYIKSVLPEFKQDAIQAKSDFLNRLMVKTSNSLTSCSGLSLNEIVSGIGYMREIDDTPENWSAYYDKAARIYDYFHRRNVSSPLEENSYGIENKAFLNAIRDIRHPTGNSEFDAIYSQFCSASGFDKLNVDLGKIKQYIWHYAVTRPHDAVRLAKAQAIYNHFTAFNVTGKYNDVTTIVGLDSLLAELYVAKDMGEGVLKQKEEKFNTWLEYYITQKDSVACEHLASGLMWLKAYSIESDTLRRIASSGVAMRVELQDRLRFLESGGDKGHVLHRTETLIGMLQFDYSSLNWKTEDYAAFFKTIVYENEILKYSLTIREWARTLTMPSNAGRLSIIDLFTRIESMIENEYDGTVTCFQQQCSILVDDSQEEVDGILLSPVKGEMGFDHISLLLNTIKIGRNLNIRIYTLFMPTADTVEKQEQQALSLKKNINPNVGAFEDGLRESVLRTLEEYINSTQNPIDNPSSKTSAGSVTSREKSY